MEISAGLGRAPRSRAARALATARHALGWPRRVLRARRLMAAFAAMEEHELRDIGLTRLDVAAAGALPLAADPSLELRRRAEERRGRLRSDRRHP